MDTPPHVTLTQAKRAAGTSPQVAKAAVGIVGGGLAGLAAVLLLILISVTPKKEPQAA